MTLIDASSSGEKYDTVVFVLLAIYIKAIKNKVKIKITSLGAGQPEHTWYNSKHTESKLMLPFSPSPNPTKVKVIVGTHEILRLN